jgi:flagellar basal-body rod protein FlgG
MDSISSLVPQMQALWRRHEVLANNLANVSTPGFKLDDVALIPGSQPSAQTGPEVIWSLGGHTLVQWTNFAPGPLVQTGRSLDVAIHGRGFLVVDTPGGPRYTRGGSLNVDGAGFLVTASGHQVQGEGGPIAVASGPVTITASGDVMAAGQRVGALRVVDFARTDRLVKQGEGLFASAEEPTAATGSEVVAGSLEASNVNVVDAMVGMMTALRQYETAQRVLQSEDEVVRRASTEIGRV